MFNSYTCVWRMVGVGVLCGDKTYVTVVFFIPCEQQRLYLEHKYKHKRHNIQGSHKHDIWKEMPLGERDFSRTTAFHMSAW